MVDELVVPASQRIILKIDGFQIWFSDIRPPGAKVNQTKPDYLKFICIIHFVYLKSMYSLFQVVNYEADPIHGFHAEGAGVPKYPH